VNEPSAYQRLGVTELATFEEIQQAKKQLEEKYQGDSQMLENLETAYDAVIMDRLKRRQEGRIKVPDGIRFPEQVLEFKQSSPPDASKTSNWLSGMLDIPSISDVFLPLGIYFALGVFSFFVATESLLSLLMSLATFGAVYFVYRKERNFGRALLLSFISLVIGVILGYLVFAGFKSSNISVFVSSEQIAATATYLILWITSSFLR
jgi:hypothetical protein